MRVLKKQFNSKMCIVCGTDNPASLHASFYEMEDNSVVSIFTYKQMHQSYPKRAHGGLITCMLDEIAGRAMWITEPEGLAVTTAINVRFRKPVCLDSKLVAVGKLVTNSRRLFTAESAIYDEKGVLLASAEVTYLKMSAMAIAGEEIHEDVNVFIPDDVTEIDLSFIK